MAARRSTKLAAVPPAQPAGAQAAQELAEDLEGASAFLELALADMGENHELAFEIALHHLQGQLAQFANRADDVAKALRAGR